MFTNTQTKTNSRQAPKLDGITDSLRAAIAQGKLKPGERLPVRTELEAQLNVSRMTVQKALDTLIREGFVVSKGKLGTYIADAPPCLNRFGLVLPFSQAHPRWNGYYDALLQSLHEINETLEHQFRIYYNVDLPTDPNFVQLCEDVKAKRLAGLMFADFPIYLDDTELLREQRVPMVASKSGDEPTAFKNMISCRFDQQSLFDLACKIFNERGCKRPAIILLSGAREQLTSLIQRAEKKHDLNINPIFCQTASMEYRDEADSLVQLMMAMPKGQRPDGLFVADDNLVPAACRGLVQARVRVGEELHLVAHRNFPSQSNNLLPMDEIGFDVRQLLNICIKRLEAKRLGDTNMKPMKIKAIHASQVAIRTMEIIK